MRLKNLTDVLNPPEDVHDDMHWSTFLAPLDKTPAREESNLPSVDVVQVDNNLDELIPTVLSKIHFIAKETPLIPGDEEYVANAKLVLSAAQLVINAQIKVDENQLKRRKADDIMSVLSALKAEEKKQLALREFVVEEAELVE